MEIVKKKIKFLPTFNFLQAKIASPSKIRNWAERFLYDDNLVLGEVETFSAKSYDINYLQEKGLFCEKIFGPLLDFTCSCGKYNNISLKRINRLLHCEKCKVELNHSSIRGINFGYLDLAIPVVNPFFIDNKFDFLELLLKIKLPDITTEDIYKIIYYNYFFEKVTISFAKTITKSLVEEAKNDKDQNAYFLIKKFLKTTCGEKLISHISTNKEYSNISQFSGIESFEKIFEQISLNNDIITLRNSLSGFINDETLLKLRFLEGFASTLTRPEWIIIKTLPVIGPSHRPFKKIESDKGELSPDLNTLYISVSDNNLEIKKTLKSILTSDLDFFEDRKLLQIAIDTLFMFDNQIDSSNNNINDANGARKGLTKILEGKKGQFRQYILGKRVDFSGRSVIISGPNLKVNQCGLPYAMASELFSEILNKYLLSKIFAFTKFKKKNKELIFFLIKKKKLIIWPILKKILAKEAIILNRAPTLHKGSLQSFNPILTLNLALYLHPMVCAAFNADFDGDQLSVNISFLNASKIENLTMLKPLNNLINSAANIRVLKPNQEIVAGFFYSTFVKYNIFKSPVKVFSDVKEVVSAFFCKKISLHESIFTKLLVNDINYNNNFNTFKKIIAKKKLSIKKFFIINNKLILLTNYGLNIFRKKNDNLFKLENFLIETTVGQIFYHKLNTN